MTTGWDRRYERRYERRYRIKPLRKKLTAADVLRLREEVDAMRRAFLKAREETWEDLMKQWEVAIVDAIHKGAEQAQAQSASTEPDARDGTQSDQGSAQERGSEG